MKAAFFEAQKFRHAENISWRHVEGEAVILDLNTSVYFSVNESGVIVWERIGGGATFAEIQEAIRREYSVEPDRARQDVETLLKQFLKAKLIVSS